jgi:hypothetical protein
MKSFLVHLASLAVMFHMTFGCNWHHGLGSAHACTNQTALSCCPSDTSQLVENDDHDHDYDGHEHGDHDSDLPLTSNFDGDNSDRDRSHFCCQDDGCNVAKVVKFVYAPMDFSTAYLGGAENSAIAQPLVPGFTVDPFPDCKCLALKMRTHLLLGVQLI